LYSAWLSENTRDANNNSDLVAFFFRRAFMLLRNGGIFGLVATNTVAQGDTRYTGLRWICLNGGQIISARKRLRWPGEAAVIVSVVHVEKGCSVTPVLLNECVAPTITAFLFKTGGHENPSVLSANSGKSFVGCFPRSMGFTFDDTEPSGTVSPVALMHGLVLKNPRNAKCIFPYIGGSEVNTNPRHEHHRYIINFQQMSEEDARTWPDLISIVEEKVRPSREALGNSSVDKAHKKYWWRFANDRPEMMRSIEGLERVLVAGQTSKYRSFTFLPNGMVYDQKLIVFPFDTLDVFCILHSTIHIEWALFMGSSMKDDPVYTPSDCFETFPFPKDFETNPALESAGQEYYEFRAALMVRNNEGLTKTYNRFHDPEERSPDIVRLRELHAAMDRAVLDAYGWTDLEPTCEFLLDYEEEDPASSDDYAVASPGRGRGRKKPWRYRWPDEFRDEVLARLLELNRQYAEEERLSGAAAEKKKRASTAKSTKNTKKEKDAQKEDELF
jgi:hypothetical protein